MAPTTVWIDRMLEGLLVRGTLDVDAARETVRLAGFKLAETSAKAGRYRKVPGQWSPWRLHEGSGRGSFDAVVLYGDVLDCPPEFDHSMPTILPACSV